MKEIHCTLLHKDGNQVCFGAEGLKYLETITDDNVIPELSQCTFRIACDVTNTLCGEQADLMDRLLWEKHLLELRRLPRNSISR